jgi:hypothetical protein
MRNEDQNLFEKLGLEEASSIRCSHNCIHYGEGCLIGYPIYSPIHGIGQQTLEFIDPEELKLMHSKEFKEYWENTLGKSSDYHLPCFHKNCKPSLCNHLHDTKFMTQWYRDYYNKRKLAE